MKEIPINLDRLQKEDLYSVATALLYTLKDTPQYSTMSELFYILDYPNFLKLIKYYGGQEVRIPSHEEINEMLSILLLYQYREVEELEWEECLKKVGADESQSKSLRGKVSALSSLLKSQEIGGRDYGNKS